MRLEMASIPAVDNVQNTPDIQRAALCCIFSKYVKRVVQQGFVVIPQLKAIKSYG